MTTYKPRVLVDFDGVIHKYSKGWQDGTVYDEPMEGAKEALQALEDAGYEVYIFSTRYEHQIVPWMSAKGFKSYPVTNVKLPATALIDDRAIRFTQWSDALADLLRLYPVKK